MEAKGQRLKPGVVAALDAARAFAAFYVVLHHVANARGWSHGAGVVLRFGQEAVLVFFLLSGFVIFANEQARALPPSGYYWRRLRRIYLPLIAALLVSTIVAWDNGDLAARFTGVGLAGTVFALQDISFLKPGVIVDPYLGNDPLWSLSYELAFYALFPFVLLVWRRSAVATEHVVGLVCCVCYLFYWQYPNHFALVGAYFLVWWAGAMAAAAYSTGSRDVRGLGRTFAWLLVLCVIAAVVVRRVGWHGAGNYPLLPFRHFAYAVLMLLLCFGPIGRWITRLALPRARAVLAVTSISYGLYVLHYPLLVDWRRAGSAAGLAMAAGVLLLLAYLVERQLPRLLPRTPR